MCILTKLLLPVASIALASLSIYLAYIWKGQTTAAWIVGAWVIIPPIFFIIEWAFFPYPGEAGDFEKFKYSQELARNVWVALVAILAYISGVKLGG